MLPLVPFGIRNYYRKKDHKRRLLDAVTNYCVVQKTILFSTAAMILIDDCGLALFVYVGLFGSFGCSLAAFFQICMFNEQHPGLRMRWVAAPVSQLLIERRPPDRDAAAALATANVTSAENPIASSQGGFPEVI